MYSILNGQLDALVLLVLLDLHSSNLLFLHILSSHLCVNISHPQKFALSNSEIGMIIQHEYGQECFPKAQASWNYSCLL